MLSLNLTGTHKNIVQSQLTSSVVAVKLTPIIVIIDQCYSLLSVNMYFSDFSINKLLV